jgi:hypothetical protein
MFTPSRESKVVGLFMVCGLTALLSNIVHGMDPLGSSSYRATLFASPSVFFTVAILLAGFVVARLRLIEVEPQFSAIRILSAGAIAALIYPVAMAGMMAAALSIYASLGSDNPSTTARWRLLLFDNAVEIAVVFGGILTVCLFAVAFRIAMKTWPHRLWMEILVIAFGVPLSTAMIEFTMRVPKPDRFLEPKVLGIPLLLVIGEPILAGYLGHWFFTATQAASQPVA